MMITIIMMIIIIIIITADEEEDQDKTLEPRDEKETEYVRWCLQPVLQDFWSQIYTLFTLTMLREWIIEFPHDHFRRIMNWLFTPSSDCDGKHTNVIASHIQWNECNLWNDILSNDEHEWVIVNNTKNAIPNVTSLWRYIISYNESINSLPASLKNRAKPIQFDWIGFDVVHCSHLLLENTIGKILHHNCVGDCDYILFSFDISKAIRLIKASDEHRALFKTYGDFLKHFRGSAGTDWDGLLLSPATNMFNGHITLKQWCHWVENSVHQCPANGDISFEEIGKTLQHLLGM
ncbi:hypothetical protein RFI_00986 [Reticulomyxa filosa]|uniref:Uncharacterized protein n=1 Tax=Reticulomyxa filosa TaxID=46433 RepID=X6PEF5_RETFI|nr:hypothetical protein RFI_00986 [Reticulomyxa filosa]|eukprot:ETO36077.1 hypothetical protein RFI_00986 [Reticulomyxa filosa]